MVDCIYRGDATDDNFGHWRQTIEEMNALERAHKEKFPDGPDDEDLPDLITEASDSVSSASSESGSEEEEDHNSDYGGKYGLRNSYPELYSWLQARLDTKTKVGRILLMALFEGANYSMQEDMYTEDVSVISLITAANVLSLFVSLAASFLFEGGLAWRKICDGHAAWRFFGISAMFVLANWCTGLAYKHGISALYRNTLGYLYLPLAALGSYVVFKRRYGQFEWLSLLMMMLAVVTFVLLRERCKAGSCVNELENEYFFEGPILYVLISIVLSVIASLLAERIFKGRSFGLMRRRGDVRKDHYYILKVHLDFSAAIFSLAYWIFPTLFGALLKSESKKPLCGVVSAPMTDPAASCVEGGVMWFGDWTKWHWLFVFITAGQWWMAGLISKRFSTVVKSVVQSLSIVVAIIVKDPLLHLYHFEQRWIPSMCMAFVIVFSALMFQTGRVNLKLVRTAVGQEKTRAIVDMSAKTLMSKLIAWLADHKPRRRRKGSNVSAGSDQELTSPMTQMATVRSMGEPETPPPKNPIAALFGSYSVLVAYIVADAMRTEWQTIAMGASMITPQSMAIMINLASMLLFCVMVVCSPRAGYTGCQGFVYAWNGKKILKFMPCGFLFAATSALISMGMGLGISGSMSVVVGKIYLPIAALASRWILGKFYLWLEWFAIIVLTLDSAAFGYLQTMGKTGRPTSPVAILCVAGSATAAALNSLVMETLLQGEGDPFIIQKVRLDAGSVFWSVVFLPVMGWLANPDSYPQGAYWNFRASTRECTWTGKCVESVFMYVNQTTGHMTPEGHAFCMEDSRWCDCSCDKGVFVYWGTNINLYLMLIISVCHSTIVGMVVKRFSSVYRAVADNFSLLLVYFVADPWVWGTSTSDKPTNLTAFILPLSSQAFTLANAELKKVEEVTGTNSNEVAYARAQADESSGEE